MCDWACKNQLCEFKQIADFFIITTITTKDMNEISLSVICTHIVDFNRRALSHSCLGSSVEVRSSSEHKGGHLL